MKKAKYKAIAFLQLSALFILTMTLVGWYAIPGLEHESISEYKSLTAEDYKRYPGLDPERDYFFKKNIVILKEKSWIPLVYKRDTLKETSFQLRSKSRD